MNLLILLAIIVAVVVLTEIGKSWIKSRPELISMFVTILLSGVGIATGRASPDESALIDALLIYLSSQIGYDKIFQPLKKQLLKE